MKARWRKIKTYEDDTGFDRVDLWLVIPASPRSMGWADAFRVPDACRRQGKWYYYEGAKEKELEAVYITHWMAMPKGPGT